MRFRTRLVITSVAIVILPLVMTIIAFFLIGRVVFFGNRAFTFNQAFDYGMVADMGGTFSTMTDEIFDRVLTDMEYDPYILEDRDYLGVISQELNGKTSFLIVRKGNDIYYTSDEEYADNIFDILPESENAEKVVSNVLYTTSGQFLRQMDFKFYDGSYGSLFIITSIKTVESSRLWIYMIIAIIIILFITSVMMTNWIKRGILKPVDDLNIAMQHIKNGNFDYVLPIDLDERGEIGELYRSYDDMRLRLKESAEEKIEREHQNKELISNISHDLKTPITAIKGYSQGLIEGIADTPEKQDKYIRTIYNKANDMNNLINELTLYSSIDNNRIPYNFQKINVASYFGDCIEEIGMDLDSKSIKLNYSNLTTPDTIIVADPEQLKRVINNIVSNSVKYLGREDGTGVIDIRLLDELDSIRVEIEDNGIGIAQKDIQNIFDRFYRTDRSRNTKAGGSGIGLSIVKKIIEDHGGYIWATSHEGEGTCMHFVLRKYADDPDQSETDTVAQEA
ncbi:MAG: HAMP domain-containing histidine kinase [Butyrivibrio sp.]|nr:HAMP domain-containing histidine kinase [Butyrivibrio sp.]